MAAVARVGGRATAMLLDAAWRALLCFGEKPHARDAEKGRAPTRRREEVDKGEVLMPDKEESVTVERVGRGSDRAEHPASEGDGFPRKEGTVEAAESCELEFGGPVGALALMLWSHAIVYYIWWCLTHNDAKMAIPLSPGGIVDLWKDIGLAIVQHAMPSKFALSFYGTFFVSQLLLASIMPGFNYKGPPVEFDSSLRLDYKINGLSSWYATLATMLSLQVFGIFDWSKLYEHYGEILTVSVLFSDILSLAVYAGAVGTGNAYRMTGSHIYDFFSGAVLHPRLRNVDLKMFTEARVSWILLFMLTFGAAVHQVKTEGQISVEMTFMLLAHGLYTNAIMKGEECIPTTWDMFYEKWGWMLIFWNCSGVPFVYCIQSFYLANRRTSSGTLPAWHYAMCYTLLLGAYYVWDVSQSQKNKFRAQLNGSYVKRKAFPQFAWGKLSKPKYLDTECGSKLLVDGLFKYARKIHYTADIVMALSWGLICGFDRLIPYFYAFFFFCMIVHRNGRDVERCKKKYKKDWDTYCQVVPYTFIPGVF